MRQKNNLNAFKVLVYLCTVRNVCVVLITDSIIHHILPYLIILEREATIYTMHRSKGGLHIVDILTNFTVPDNKDQAYVLDEIVEKVYSLRYKS